MMAEVDNVIQLLMSKAEPENIPGMKRFGMSEESRLGIPVPELRAIAKSLGKDHQLAQELWNTRIAEARILASMVAEPDKLTGEQMDRWVEDFDSWGICDQVGMNLFDKTPLAWKKIPEWSQSEEEFIRRASLALIACLAWHDKQAKDALFVNIMPVIRSCATDERNFVKKAASWALRNIGKRNRNLNLLAIQCAAEIQAINSKSARWIAADVLRELNSEAVQKKLK